MNLEQWLTGDRIVMAMYIYNCAVQALPEPGPSKVYQFIYGFMHALAGNINVVRKVGQGGRFPVPSTSDSPAVD